MSLRVGALCSGYGGLELALGELGLDTVVSWFAEISEPAAAVMSARFGAPNLGDLAEVDCVESVDVVTAGFPCQPFSVAAASWGTRRGVDDERWLIDDVVSIWVSSGARWLVLENVRGLFSASDGEAFGKVVDALSNVGAYARWSCVRAADIGACHRRDRWFCLVSRDGVFPSWELDLCETAVPDVLLPTPTARDHKDTPGMTLHKGHESDTVPRAIYGLDRAGITDWGRYAPAIERHEFVFGRQAPPPLVDGKLSPRFVEWMMMLPDGWVSDFDVSRTKKLQMLGNGVVPRQAAAALAALTACGASVEA